MLTSDNEKRLGNNLTCSDFGYFKTKANEPFAMHHLRWQSVVLGQTLRSQSSPTAQFVRC